MGKARQIRSDIRVGSLEERLGLDPGSIRNPDGTDARSDKKLGTLRKEFADAKGRVVKTNPAISAHALAKAAKAVESLNQPNATMRNGKRK